MVTQRDIAKLLENASEQELNHLAYSGCEYAMQHPDMAQQERHEWACFMNLVAIEAGQREIEPLWRKARRFAVRNSGTFKEIGKVAAGVALGILVGDSLTSWGNQGGSGEEKGTF
jgi:hypothetical protein